MKRVLLINSNSLTAPYPVPPLGLCLVAEALKDQFEVLLYDGTFQGAGALSGAVRSFAPHYVGLGLRNIDDMIMPAPTFYLDDIVRDFIKPLREATPAELILGGSGFSLMPRQLMERLKGDYGVVGAGEEPMVKLLSALENGAAREDLLTIPGVIVRGVGESWVGQAPPARVSAAKAGNVHRWLDFSPYLERGSYPLQTRRGCAHNCVYCTYPLLEGRRPRPRDPVDVADEIQQAADDLGPCVTFEFVDSTFNAPPGQAEAICKEIAGRGLGGVRLRTMGINPATADRELFRLMKGAGFTQIDITPDSASPKMLRTLGKGFTRKDLVRAARGIADESLPAMWFFLLGGPGEDLQTLASTLSFIDRHVQPEDMVYMSAGLRIYPGTPLHRTALDEATISQDNDLVQPRFYVSSALDAEALISWVKDACATRLNCVPAWESRPPPRLMERAMKERRDKGLEEPIFRTLIRLRRQEMESTS